MLLEKPWCGRAKRNARRQLRARAAHPRTARGLGAARPNLIKIFQPPATIRGARCAGDGFPPGCFPMPQASHTLPCGRSSTIAPGGAVGRPAVIIHFLYQLFRLNSVHCVSTTLHIVKFQPCMSWAREEGPWVGVGVGVASEASLVPRPKPLRSPPSAVMTSSDRADITSIAAPRPLRGRSRASSVQI
ncbi:LAFE_0D09934g1_1 [Lachancea fermentati]|uniref:LAFE_0D09934g1_1 n=1 Tax=Lachancea fermentati TaxID=4955 RepID=A0A1G4MBM7_LACFM|nr:LAFE_0D09934g1_1 [Lachancea fermentati]